MRNLKRLLLVMAITLTCNNYSLAQYTHYSEWMANSRNYKVYKSGSYKTFTTSDGNSGDFWRYDDGLMYEAILDTYHRYETNTSLLEGVRDYLKWCFQGSSSPYIKNLETTTLDDMRPGRLVWKYKRTYSHSDTDYDSKYEAALSALMQTSAFANSSRVTINGSTGKGYPWQHKSNLEGQVWLDGIFMGLPFWTLAGPVIGSGRNEYSSWTTSDFFEDAVSQILKTDEKTYGDELGLWAHAWDGEGDEAWSTKNSSFTTGSNVPPHADIEEYAHDGRSSHCWGRALGWYAMAIMETMDNIQLQNGSGTYNTQINTLKPIFKKVMDKVIETRDPSSGVWYCVLDVGDNSSATSPYYGKGPKNNYIEATCSSMFAYCLLHGVAQGYLDTSYTTVAQDVYNSVVTQFIKDDSGNKKLINCDQVAGLGGTSTVDGTTYNRDGSFAYYMLEKKIDNDSKGIGPFIWASLAAETTPYNYTISTGFPSIESNGIVQFRWSKVADNITTPSNYVSPTFTAKTSGGTTLTNSTDITFVSDNTDVATVAADGTITLAGEAGTANITATRTGGSYAGAAIYTVTTTGADTTAPTLESSTPATGAKDVAVSGHITLTFSEDVTIVDASKFTLSGGAGTLNTAEATVSGATITIPYSGLANSTNYTLSVAADAVKDLADNTNDALENITFTTIAPDETAPTLNSSTPTNKATNVATSGNITLTFDENVTIVDESKFTLSGGAGTLNTAGATVSGATVTIPYSGLANSTAYTLATEAGAVKDGSNNLNAALSNITFTTAAAAAHNASDPATTTLNGITFLDVANTTNNTTITSTNTKCVTYGLYYLGNKWKPSWKGGSTSNFDSTGDSGDFTAQGFLSSDAPASGSSNATAAATSGIGDAKIRNTDSYKHIFYVTGITGVAILNTDDKSSDNRQVYINIEEYNALGTSTTDIGTTQSTFNNSFHVTSYTAATLTADKYYKITLTGGNTSNACGKVAQIRFTQGSSSPTPTTYTLTNTVNEAGYGTVSPPSVASIPSGTATSSSTNTYTVNGTTVTATPAKATAEYTYAFSGWSGLPATVMDNATVKANFTRTAKSYDLAWNSNGGSALSGDYTSGTVPFGTAITAPNNPTRDGYTFNGWNTDDDGSGTPLGSTMPAANTTYYAQWTENTGGTSAIITYVLDVTNNGTTLQTISGTVSTNANITVTPSTSLLAGGLETGGSHNNGDKNKHNGTRTLGINTLSQETADKYFHVDFSVAEGYKFIPSAISLKALTIGGNETSYKAVLTDGTNQIVGTVNATNDSEVTLGNWSGINSTELTGNVSLKLYAWYTTSGTYNAYRLSTPITITGTITETSEPIIPTYTVTATSNNNNWGTVSVDKATAAVGATVTITTSPASGYELTSLTATDGESNDVTITNNQFTMPASNVTVNATFAALPPVLGAVTFSPAGGNYSSEQNVTISATNAEEIWYSTVSQAAAVKNGANATQYTSAIHIGEGTTTLYATAYLGENSTTGNANYTVTIPDVGNGTELYTFSMSGSTINFANGDKENFSITNNKSCQIESPNKIKFRWHASNNEYGQFTLTSKNNIPIQSVRLVATIEGDDKSSWGETETVHQNVAVTNGTYDPETMTWTANSDDVTSVTFTNNYDATYNGNIYISKIIVVFYAPETITIAEAGFSTLYKTYAVSVGDGGTAYYVSDIRNKNVVLTPFANNIIPANTGAVIKGTFGDEVTLNRAIADEFTTTNYLLGTDTKQNITADKDNYYYFISGRQKQADNSYKYGWLVPNALKTTSVFSNNANKAYLRVPKAMLDNETSARILSLIWEDVEQPITTGLNRHNYQFVIDDKTPIYNLSGQRVSKDYKGIVIINGKKFVRK